MTLNEPPVSSNQQPPKFAETPQMTLGGPQSFFLASNNSRAPTGPRAHVPGQRTLTESGLCRPCLGIHGPLVMQVSPLAGGQGSRHETAWDEGTIYGRIAVANQQAAATSDLVDRDEIYCERAAQAISDFDKKF